MDLPFYGVSLFATITKTVHLILVSPSLARFVVRSPKGVFDRLESRVFLIIEVALDRF